MIDDLNVLKSKISDLLNKIPVKGGKNDVCVSADSILETAFNDLTYANEYETSDRICCLQQAIKEVNDLLQQEG